ncbi:Aldo/keto reductase [Fomitopsis serialis]|uniref:Aldo/keto reductase n=1 Tax=Fomitopsis serialis TaxID=139415 RepID=UPI0020082D36|nr:Aldo/keto reductase [Neoantrodia serialis]KAH9920103.1 Aldo/keto reductase [Neoantrodia serialis]
MSNWTRSLQSTVRLSSGYDMPLLGFGVYQNYNTKDSVIEALEAGYRHIDTAQAYRNEAHVGAAVKASGMPRGEIFVTTKCTNKTHGYESTLSGVDASLQRFEFDYIDLFLIHDPMSGHERRLETYKALQNARAAGKIRTVGVSNYGIKHLEEIAEAGYEMPAVNQIELHPFCQQKPIVEYCRGHSIVIQAYCPILRGNMDHPTITEISRKHQRDPAQVLLRWSLQKGLAFPFRAWQCDISAEKQLFFRFVPLPKSATPARIRSNALLYDFVLDDTDMAKLDALDRGKEGSISWNPVDWD